MFISKLLFVSVGFTSVVGGFSMLSREFCGAFQPQDPIGMSFYDLRRVRSTEYKVQSTEYGYMDKGLLHLYRVEKSVNQSGSLQCISLVIQKVP